MSVSGAMWPPLFHSLQEVTQAWHPTHVSRSMTSPSFFSVPAGRQVIGVLRASTHFYVDVACRRHKNVSLSDDRQDAGYDEGSSPSGASQTGPGTWCPFPGYDGQGQRIPLQGEIRYPAHDH